MKSYQKKIPMSIEISNNLMTFLEKITLCRIFLYYTGTMAHL